jgi:hypothetical protein
MSEAERGNAGSPAKADNSAEALARALADAMPLTFNAGGAGSDAEIGGIPSIASSAVDRLWAQKQLMVFRSDSRLLQNALDGYWALEAGPVLR